MLGHNPHIVHCFAKIAKSLEIKEEVTTNQRKTYVKRIKLIRFRILLILRVKSILRYFFWTQTAIVPDYWLCQYQ